MACHGCRVSRSLLYKEEGKTDILGDVFVDVCSTFRQDERQLLQIYLMYSHMNNRAFISDKK